eukprot:COSAG02_NODE_154_length_33067_cov_38.282092_14_plen_288_part_00
MWRVRLAPVLWYVYAAASFYTALPVNLFASTAALAPILLGNCTCPKDGPGRRLLGESFLALPLIDSTGATVEVVLTFFASDGELLEARTADAGTTWSAFTISATNWTGSAPRCTTAAPSGGTLSTTGPQRVICAIADYPTGAVARTAIWDPRHGKIAWEYDTQKIWRGMDGGGIRHTIALASGRVLCMLQSNGWNGTTHFPAESVALYSDPPYTTWHRSVDAIWCNKTPGSCYGAVEPVAAERADGTILALMRTQVGVLWQAVSTDRGETFTTGAPSTLASTDSPCV